MPRKISTGLTGGPILGTLNTQTNIISPNVQNTSIIISPTGTGETQIESHLEMTNGFSVKFSDSDGSNYIALKAPSTVASNVTFNLPTADGTSGQIIQTDASGNLSFVDVRLPVTDNTVSASTFYPMLSDQTSGNENAIVVSSSKLSFVPSTGTLTANNVTVTTALQAGTITETSSLALKENINPVENAIDKILQLNPVTYTRKETGEIETGLIAEQVASVLPEVVQRDEEGNPKTIAYSRLTAYLIQAVQVLTNEIKELSNKR